MIGSVKASGAPDGGRRQRETTHELFSCSRSCKRITRQARKNAKKFKFFFLSLFSIFPKRRYLTIIGINQEIPKFLEINTLKKTQNTAVVKIEPYYGGP